MSSRLSAVRVCVSTAICIVALGAASSARASSIVFVKTDGNVWAARPDGSHQRRITSDGSRQNPYFAPSQGRSGTIAAARGTNKAARIFRFSRSGKRQGAPLRPGLPVISPTLSPDGSKVAFFTMTSGAPCYGLLHQTFFCFNVSRSDRYGSLTRPAWMNFEYPAWVSSSRLLLFTGSGQLSYADLAKSGYRTWLSWLDFFNARTDGFGQWISGAASPDGRRLALVTHIDTKNRFVIQLLSSPADVRTGDLSRVRPTLSSCVIAAPDRSNGADPQHRRLPSFDSLSFSPDGRSLAFGFKGAVYTTTLGSLSDCRRITTHRIIKGASDPNWGQRSA